MASLVNFGMIDSYDSARRRGSDSDFRDRPEVDSSLLELDDGDGVRRRLFGILYSQSSSDAALATLSGACVGASGCNSDIGGSSVGRSGRRMADCMRLPVL